MVRKVVVGTVYGVIERDAENGEHAGDIKIELPPTGLLGLRGVCIVMHLPCSALYRESGGYRFAENTTDFPYFITKSSADKVPNLRFPTPTMHFSSSPAAKREMSALVCLALWLAAWYTVCKTIGASRWKHIEF